VIKVITVNILNYSQLSVSFKILFLGSLPTRNIKHKSHFH